MKSVCAVTRPSHASQYI